jgi:hypothetical protein
VAYDPNVIRQFDRAIRLARASPREALALKEAGIVESGLRKLTYGDRDSTGALQQRPSQGWGPASESVLTDAVQFLHHAKAINRSGFKGSAGQLAQAVQRSAFPGRYDAVRSQAVGLPGSGSDPLRSAVSPAASSTSSGGVPVDTSAGGTQVASLLAALQQRPAVAASSPAPPAFAAGPTLPQGYTPPPSGGGPAPRVDTAALMDLVRTQGGDTTSGQAVAPAVPQQASAPAQAARLGTVKVGPGANRAGVDLSPGILHVVRRVAAVAGRSLTIGTGTNHSERTVNGNVSDHWGGNAADIPASGKDLVKLGQDALIAAGMPAAQARKQTGGLFNVPYGKHRRIQVIFATNEGGNHFNHLHVGVTAR